MLPFLLILLFYIRILFAILKMSSTTGRQKAFSTCASHLMCYPLLWHSQYDLLTTQIWLLPRNQEADVLVLLTSYASAESTDLQFEKQ